MILHFTDVDSVQEGEKVHEREERQQMPVDLAPQTGDICRVRVEAIVVLDGHGLLVVLFVHPDPDLAAPAGFNSHPWRVCVCGYGRRW